MTTTTLFERLIETAGLIARHPDYPGKSEALALCREEVEDLARDGRITADQGEALREVLLGIRPMR